MMYKIFLFVFGAIGLFNIGVGALLTVDKILKSGNSKANIWMYIYVIITALSFVALKELFSM